jgi:RimJ/RimL family protein N-acetyltransferase
MSGAVDDMTDLSAWQPRPRPGRVTLAGSWCRLEPLDATRHGDSLFAASMAPGAEQRFRYLPDTPLDRPGFDAWLARAVASEDPLFYAVLDAVTGRCEGRQSLLNIIPAHGTVELGHILWGPAIARGRVATEAMFLAASYAFDELGYRRFEWKCNALNEPSVRAARRFGFTYEGTFRQHMVIKGQNRDSSWFSILDREWPAIRAAFEQWLAPDNFDGRGAQRRRLADFMPVG